MPKNRDFSNPRGHKIRPQPRNRSYQHHQTSRTRCVSCGRKNPNQGIWVKIKMQLSVSPVWRSCGEGCSRERSQSCRHFGRTGGKLKFFGWNFWNRNSVTFMVLLLIINEFSSSSKWPWSMEKRRRGRGCTSWVHVAGIQVYFCSIIVNFKYSISVPCDLGVRFLKKNFHGDLSYIESYVQTVHGPAVGLIDSILYLWPLPIVTLNQSSSLPPF